MPNKKAAIKDLKQTSKRTESNNLIKREIKEIIKRGEKFVQKGETDGLLELQKTLQKVVDKAVKNGVLKPNTGSRRKARFNSLLKKTTTVQK